MSPEDSLLLRMNAAAAAARLCSERKAVSRMFKHLRARLGFGSSAVDHAQTKEELQQKQGEDLRGPNARTDPWYSGPVSDRSFVDEGRPRK